MSENRAGDDFSGILSEETVAEPVINPGHIIRNLLIAVSLILLVACAVEFFMYRSAKSDYNKIQYLFTTEYYEFNSLNKSTFEKKVASGEDFVVIIGRPTCSDCREMHEPFVKLTDELGIRDKVYYFNIAPIHSLVAEDGTREEWTKYKEKYGLTGTPNYVRFKDGKLYSMIGWTEENGINIDAVRSWIMEQSDYFGF